MEGMSPNSKLAYSIQITESDDSINLTQNTKSKTSLYFLKLNDENNKEFKHLKANSKFCDNNKLKVYSNDTLTALQNKTQSKIKNLTSFSANVSPDILKTKTRFKLDENLENEEINQFSCFKEDKIYADLILKEGIKTEKDFDTLFEDPILKRIFNLKE